MIRNRKKQIFSTGGKSACGEEQKKLPDDDGGEGKDHAGKQGMGIHIYSIDKHILKNQEHDDAKTGQQVLGNNKWQGAVFKEIGHHGI